MAGGLAGSVVRAHLNLISLVLTKVPADCSRPQIRPQWILGAVQVLRLRQRLAERRHDAFRSRSVDSAEFQ